MPNVTDYLLIGGGLASASAAEAIRNIDGKGSIAIVSSERVLPYNRPPLSKDYLRRKRSFEGLLINDREFYKKKNIELHLGTRVKYVDIRGGKVETDSGGILLFQKLLLATGAHIKKLQIPGADLDRVHYLRTYRDSDSLSKSMKSSERAVVIGSSFISMELAAAMADAGIKTTIVAREDLLYSKLVSPEISEFFEKYYKDKGVRLIFGDTLKKITGGKKVTGVETEAGRKLKCDIVAIGIGVTPNTGFIDGSGIEIDDGVRVNEYMETNVKGIYAAGDVANAYDPVFGEHRRIEHWDNALKQGRVAGRNMAGMRTQFRHVTYFFSDVFDLSFNFIGRADKSDRRIIRGSIEKKSFSVLYMKDRTLRAAFIMSGSEPEQNILGSLIECRTDLKDFMGKLSDEDFELEDLPLQNVLMLQGGGALGAFECGAYKAMEEKKILPDVVSGISIGSFNAAIIASNPGSASGKLEDFWEEISLNTPYLPDEKLRKMTSSLQSMAFGTPHFFRPRWLSPPHKPFQLPYEWTSLYDTSPMTELLRKYIDFENLKSSPVRLLVSAVNVETAELETFDSYIDDITPEHIMASGSLPPGLPWTTINGNRYWDGGIVSNTPLNIYMEKFGLAGKRIYIVNLYHRSGKLPENIIDVLSRKDEIFYSERLHNEIRISEKMDDYKKLVKELVGHLDERQKREVKSRPLYLEMMNRTAPLSITRIEREDEESAVFSKDYDFSRRSIKDNIGKGYKAAMKTLKIQERTGRNPDK